jgi:peptide/nickel transport system substrate-binding protein
MTTDGTIFLSCLKTESYSDIHALQLRTLGTQSQVNTLLNALPQYPYNLAKAKQEMAQSAYPRGFAATTDIGSQVNYPNVAQVIAAELSKIGITLKVAAVPESKYLANYSSGPPGGDMFAALGAVSPDPSILPSYALGSQATYNVAHYAPASVDSLLAAGLAASSPAKRLTIYGQLLKQVATDVPYVVLFAGLNSTAVSSKYTLPPFYEYPGFFSWALHIKQAG